MRSTGTRRDRHGAAHRLEFGRRTTSAGRAAYPSATATAIPTAAGQEATIALPTAKPLAGPSGITASVP